MKLNHSGFELYDGIQKKLVDALLKNKQIQERVQRLMSIPGVGEVTALTWVLEIGELTRFCSSRHAISYCGLCSAQHESTGKEQCGPISKQRNKHLQATLIEAAKFAPRWNEQLAMFHARVNCSMAKYRYLVCEHENVLSKKRGHTCFLGAH
ncbi:MAG: IS110 family transposase [Desulfuromonadaceae bacterium]|nr:IS110 family transposase [Desulfuromonadaceae bacterium]